MPLVLEKAFGSLAQGCVGGGDSGKESTNCLRTPKNQQNSLPY